jgi:hypothetical protein
MHLIIGLRAEPGLGSAPFAEGRRLLPVRRPGRFQYSFSAGASGLQGLSI